MLQKIKNLFFHLPKSIICNFIQGNPSKELTLIGVTGTDGKTTTSILLYQALKKAGFKTGVITTIGAEYADNQKIDTGLHMTSPDPSLTQKILKEMQKAGVTHVVCEVTAHALDQYRYHGVNFDTAILTNTSHEHLDYFSNLDHYIETKSKIFNQAQHAILNKDDQSFNYIKSKIKIPFSTFSIKNKSNFQATNIKNDNKELQFKVNDLLIKTDSKYNYQINNILAALAVFKKLNIDSKYLIETVKKFPQTKGRREEVPNTLKINAIIDFAHTPAALESTLSSLKKKDKKLIVIFGATGGRDKTKRPQMGKIVSELSDIAFITADDTSNENIKDINQDIISGINPQQSQYIDYQQLTPKKIKELSKEKNKKFIYFNIPNRQDAFNLAVKISQAGDTIIACGKGHENTILHGRTEYPWSESEAFRTAFNFKKL